MCKFKTIMLSLLVSSASLIAPITQADEIDINIPGNELAENNQAALGQTLTINVENVGKNVEVHVAAKTPGGDIILLTEEGGLDPVKKEVQFPVTIPDGVETVGLYEIYAVTTEVGVDDPTDPANWTSQLAQENVFVNRK